MSESETAAMDRNRMVLICGAILLVATAITVVIFNTEPAAERSGATRESAMLVDVVRAERGDFSPEIRVVGTVEAARDIVLSPRVSGEILELHSGFTPGGFVKNNEPLLQIDPVDYRQLLEQRRNELRQAEADFAIEQGRADVARRDFELLEESIGEEDRALVLRKPQLDAARSRVDSARTAVDQAELALSRTTVKAPFDAHIISRNANVGSQVTPGDNLGRLVGTGQYWISATVPLQQLRWLDIPDTGNGQPGSRAVVRNRTAWGADADREGRLFRLVGALSEDTRMARVLISVDDPLARLPDNTGKPKLMVGAFVETVIQGRRLENVVRINRDYLRQDDTVWVMRDGKLEIRPVGIVMEDASFAYIGEGLEGGESVLTTNLASVTEGAPLRLKSENASDAGNDHGGGES